MKKIQIGNQVWASSNLDVVEFRNGDLITEAKTSEDWVTGNESQTPMWCDYEFDSANGVKYGKFYNWFAVSDSRGLAPEGWDIPSDSDWDELMRFVSDDKGLDTLDEVAAYLKGVAGVDGSDYRDHYGFNAEPLGRIHMGGDSQRAGEGCYWWSASEKEGDGGRGGQNKAGKGLFANALKAFGRTNSDFPELARYRAISDGMAIGGLNKMFGLSVRCLCRL
jgi:uncharacterized protein (TIGR02145 family)